jgi:hypothetical protein
LGFDFCGLSACRAEAAAGGEGWRPGLDLNQDKERCIALASTLSATGPSLSLPIAPQWTTLERN